MQSYRSPSDLPDCFHSQAVRPAPISKRVEKPTSAAMARASTLRLPMIVFSCSASGLGVQKGVQFILQRHALLAQPGLEIIAGRFDICLDAVNLAVHLMIFLGQAREMGMPLFVRGATPLSSTHFDMYPWDYDVPIGCGDVLVMPGDIIVADDDGVVVVPPKVAPQVIKYCAEREEAEVFERIKLEETGDIAKYYPLNEEGRLEYEEWSAQQQS